MRKTCKRFLATLLTMALFISMGATALAAEPAQTVSAENAEATNIAPQSNEDNGIMPLGIGGYAAKYTNPLNGSFTVDAPGNGSGWGTFQITTHDFPTSPTITAVLYRPDGSYACQIYIDGNGTKQARFFNAVPGTYTVAYGVASDVGGWISAWVSS